MLSPLLALLLYALAANSINACGTIQKTNITAEVGDSVELVCSWNVSGSWIGNDGDGIECLENSKKRRCIIETIELENDQDQLEMTLYNGGECLIKCIFTLVVITPKLSQSLITATESAELNTATINASAPSTSTVTLSTSTVASTAAATTIPCNVSNCRDCANDNLTCTKYEDNSTRVCAKDESSNTIATAVGSIVAGILLGVVLGGTAVGIMICIVIDRRQKNIATVSGIIAGVKESSTDGIVMQTCEPYQLSKAANNEGQQLYEHIH